MENPGDERFTLIAFGHTLSCPQFRSLTELEIFISSELRVRSLDVHALEIIKSGDFTLTTKKVCVVSEDALSQVTPGQIVALEHHSSEQHLSPLRNIIPVINRGKIVIFGDSIIELSNYDPLNGLDHCLTREYWNQYHVIKHGFSGMNTNVGKEVLPYCLPAEGLEYLIILLGTNDYCLPPDPRHVSKSTYGQNIRDMVLSHVVRAQKPKMVLIISAPPPRQRIQEVPLKGKIRDEATALQYAEELRCVSEELEAQQVYMFDLCTAIMNATEGGDRSKFYARNDDIHLSEFGNEFLAQGVRDTLRTAPMRV